MIANKNFTIKNAPDEDLLKIMDRLRMENEVQNLIRRLKENAVGDTGFETFRKIAVPTDTPINELYHYGVPGMKWGRRKKPGGGYERTGRSAKGSKTREDLSKISDTDLRKKLNRLQMEKQYSQLTSSQKRKGKNVVTKLLGEVGKEVAKEVLRETIKVGTDPAKDAAKAAVKSALDAVVKKVKKG